MLKKKVRFLSIFRPIQALSTKFNFYFSQKEVYDLRKPDKPGKKLINHASVKRTMIIHPVFYPK